VGSKAAGVGVQQAVVQARTWRLHRAHTVQLGWLCGASPGHMASSFTVATEVDKNDVAILGGIDHPIQRLRSASGQASIQGNRVKGGRLGQVKG